MGQIKSAKTAVMPPSVGSPRPEQVVGTLKLQKQQVVPAEVYDRDMGQALDWMKRYKTNMFIYKSAWEEAEAQNDLEFRSNGSIPLDAGEEEILKAVHEQVVQHPRTRKYIPSEYQHTD